MAANLTSKPTTTIAELAAMLAPSWKYASMAIARNPAQHVPIAKQMRYAITLRVTAA
jgi:hypothetical protein